MNLGVLLVLRSKIDGEKELTLFSPHHNERLYEGYIPEAILGFSSESGTQFQEEMIFHIQTAWLRTNGVFSACCLSYLLLFVQYLKSASCMLYSSTSGAFSRTRLLESMALVMSPVDIKKPDFNRFPLFKKARPMKCRLTPGDALFMPAFWWHEVQSRPGPATKRNLAVNFW